MMWFRVLIAGGLILGTCLATWRASAARTGEWRTSLLLSTTAIGVLVAVGTELLSLVQAVNVVGLLVLYAAYLAAVLLAIRSAARAERTAPPPPVRALIDPWATAGALIVATLLVLAVVAPPNNWDSMTYHMSRVAQWAAQGEVGHYATHIDRQLFIQPWAEYAILHTYLLAGSDLLANTVQWAAMVVTMVAVTVVARDLGLGRSAQLATAVVVLTLPMGVTQAVTTQNDYVATMWVTILAAFVLADRSPVSRGVRGALLIGTVAGLAAMTKATSYFFIAPLLLWWLVRWVRENRSVGGMSKAVLIVAIPALALTAPAFLRNLDTFSRPFGPPLAAFVNEPIGPRATAENVLRHVAVQLGTPSASVNQKIAETTRSVGSAVGLDVDREGSTFPAGYQFSVTFGYREDDAQAFAATVLLVAAIPVLWFARRRRSPPGRRSALTPLMASAGAGALLLESYFRWNPWNGRYLLPVFVLTAVATGAALDLVPRIVRSVVLTALLVSSLLWVLGSDLRPVVRDDSVLVTSRTDQYFAARPDLQVPYLEATSYVRAMRPERVGYIGSEDDWEYPLWVLLNEGDAEVTLESVRVANASRRYERPLPDIVLCTRVCPDPPGPGGWTVRRFDQVSVWTRS